MTDVIINKDKLILDVEGMDKIWALKSSLSIPLKHVQNVSAEPETAIKWWLGFRFPGTHLPGVIAAGTFYRNKEKIFWDVHNPKNTIIIELKNSEYSKLIIEVKDPSAAVKLIKSAI